LPLRILVKQNGPPMLLAELANFRRFRIAIGLGPLRPDPDVRISPVNVLIQRAKDREAVEQIAFTFAIQLEVSLARPAAQKFHEPNFKNLSPPGVNLPVRHVPRPAKARQPFLRPGPPPQALRSF